MPFPTVPVTISLISQDGSPIVGAHVNAILDRADSYQGSIVVPRTTISGTTDSTGICVLDVFPNQLGSTGSSYTFKISNASPSYSAVVNAVIPNAACNLSDYADLPTYPPSNTFAIDAEVSAIASAASSVASDNARALAVIALAGAEAERLGSEAAAAASNLSAADSQASYVLSEASHQASVASAAASEASRVASSVSAAASDVARAASVVAKTASEAARDAALIHAGVYVDEPTGRAAVADGVAFKVQGSGDVAAYEYRRVNAGVVSTLIGSYPSSNILPRISALEDMCHLSGRNLFDPSKVIIGYEVYGTGEIRARPDSTASGKIYVKNQTHITVSGLQDNAGWGRYACFYEADGVTLVQNSNMAWENSHTWAVPSGAAWFRFSPKQRETVPTPADYSTLMLEYGDIAHPYEVYFELPEIVAIGGNIFPSTNFTYLPVSSNLLDTFKIVEGKEVYGTGALSNRANCSITPAIYVKDLAYITISGLQPNTGFARNYCFYAADGTTVILVSNIGWGNNGATLKVPSGAEWFRLSLKQRETVATPPDYSTAKIEIGKLATAYDSYLAGISTLDESRLAIPNELYGKFELKKILPSKFLFFGDSITQTGDPNVANFGVGVRGNWPLYAKDQLEIVDFKNYGMSGASFREYSGQLTWQKTSVQVSTAATNLETPEVIVIACGTNDGTANLGTYAAAMAKTTLASLDMSLTIEAMRWAFWSIRTNWPSAVCFACTPIQRGDMESSTRQALIDAIKEMAGRYGFIIIDAHTESGIVKDFEFAGSAGRYLNDGLHPNPAGQKLMANLIVSKIKNHFNY